MTRIRIKRVYEAPAPDDGCRVLVDKLWPRGVRKEALPYDIWARDIAPSAARGITPILRRGGRSSAAVIRRSCAVRRPCGILSARLRMQGP